MAEKQVMNDLDLENANGGMRINTESEGAKYLFELLSDPILGSYVGYYLVDKRPFPNHFCLSIEEGQVMHKMMELSEKYPDLIEEN